VLVIAAAGAAGCSGSPGAGEETATGPGPVTIYLTRHGETMLNRSERVQGWADSPLTRVGEEVAVDLGEGLAAEDVELEAAYSADMVRHHSTAALALEGAGQDLEPVRDERLREIAFGSFDGGSNDEMYTAAAGVLGYADQGEMFASLGPDLSFDDVLEAIAASNADDDLPAETPADVSERALAALTDIAGAQQEAGGGDVLVVSSGITISLVLAELGAEVTGQIANAAVSLLVYEDGAWRVDSVNDLRYVEAGARV